MSVRLTSTLWATTAHRGGEVAGRGVGGIPHSDRGHSNGGVAGDVAFRGAGGGKDQPHIVG